MDPVILTYNDYQAIFSPLHGMNLISFKRAGIEVIDQETKEAFLQRSAGLGALIGPHFHRRNLDLIPYLENPLAFPQSAYCRAHGIEDFFSHGVARYVPWKYECKENRIKAVITGNDVWCGVPLAVLENQNFQMTMEVSLDEKGVHIQLSVVSDSASLVGLHYYYRLPKGKGVIKTQTKENRAMINLEEAIDSTFHPFPDLLHGEIVLETEEFILRTAYECASEENCFQIYHPKDASYVCIEPISAQNPRSPNLTVSSLLVHLAIR